MVSMVEGKSPDPEVLKVSKKRKKAAHAFVAKKGAKLDSSETVEESEMKHGVPRTEPHAVTSEELLQNETLPEEVSSRFPVLKNEELVQKFLAVPLTNNQKGRIRQCLRDNLKGTSELMLPDVIHNRIKAILKSTENLNDTDLRKIRILYNMLKTSLIQEKKGVDEKKMKKKTLSKEKKAKKSGKQKETETKEIVKKGEVELEKKEQLSKKEKGKKRYVVFIGNLPLDVTKEMIMKHFSEMDEHIVNIRLPKLKEDQKSGIAYVELKNEPTFELALSKHHSMIGKKRINVQYTTQKNGKISKAQAKSKSAKLLALQKSGKLIGSTPLNRKRSQRRLKMKKARAAEERGQ